MLEPINALDTLLHPAAQVRGLLPENLLTV
jgi:hypothetical protein